MKNLTLLFCISFGFISHVSAIDRSGVDLTAVDLSGSWNVRLDPNDVGEKEKWFDVVKGVQVELPGTTTEAGIGDPLALEPALTKEVFHHLYQPFRYVGSAWYTRTFTVDDDWQNDDAVLLLERVIWESTVWLNGNKIGSQDSLSTPHRHAIGEFLKPGENTIAIRVDNRPKVDIGVLGHAYTDETQTIWNGIIGKIEIVSANALCLEIKTNPLRVVVPEAGMLEVKIESLKPNTAEIPLWSTEVDGAGEVTVDVASDDVERWSEFDPALYRITSRFRGKTGKQDQRKTIVTGFRSVETDGRKLIINGKPSFMRGTLECCIFPKTGYPPTSGEPGTGWDKVFQTLKDYGLNHLRFHSWCPPEAAFAAADQHGVYLQIELPNWTFKMGQLPAVDEYLLKEGERIIREYAHHPSFVFFSMGNELTGDVKHLDKMIKHYRKLAPKLLYTSTSYAFSPRGEFPGPEDDFFISQKTKTGWVRGQGFLNQTSPTTDSDYATGLQCLRIPLITHEVGQYNVYPNLAELAKYDGNLRALNFEAIKQDLQQKGRLDEAASYTLNSGLLAAVLYKEDIERALRTAGLSGIQLLDLHDFPGQSTATVGLLDAFWDSKGIITPEEFRKFSAPVVPLVRLPKRAWNGDETLTANVEVANFSGQPIVATEIEWKIEDAAGVALAQGTFDGVDIPLGNGNSLGEIEFPLTEIEAASSLRLTVSVGAGRYVNDWKFWVYPDTQPPGKGDVVIIRSFGKKLFDALANGRRVLFLPSREEIANPLDGRFIPVFWSPLHFENQPGSLGTVIDSEHPIFAAFPTSTHTDWQWWELLATSTSVNGDELGKQFEPIMQFIDKYNRNSLPAILWEANVGPGSLVVCSLDIESEPEERIVAAQLKRSILSYMNSSQFVPAQTLTAKQLSNLFRSRPYSVMLEKGTSHPGYPLANLQDGDNDSIWHSDWRTPTNEHPYSIRFDMTEPMIVEGLDYQPRRGNSNGRVVGYRVSISEDGTSWQSVMEGENPPQQIRFPEPRKTSHIRFEALSEMGSAANAAIAELAPRFADETTDVDELGLIEGFNQ